MYYPKISIITPSFNQVQYLEESIRSVLDQNYPNLEYIIVDGGSTDGSLEIIKKYESQVNWWCCEKDNGHGDALNKGFSHSNGEIMAWLNSDDKYFPWTLYTVAEIFNQFDDVLWIVGKNAWYDEKGRLLDSRNLFLNKYDYLSLRNEWIQQESVFWHRSLWEISGSRINQEYKYMVDGDLWMRFFINSPLWHVNMVLSGYRGHNSNRALLNKDCVHSEMQKIINLMFRNSDKLDQRIAKKVKLIRSIQHVLIRTKLKTLVNYMIKLIYLLTFTKIEKDKLTYKTLSWKNACWIKNNVFFNIH